MKKKFEFITTVVCFALLALVMYLSQIFQK